MNILKGKSCSFLLIIGMLMTYILPSLASAQNELVRREQVNSINDLGGGTGVIYSVSKTNTTGSPYLNDTFIKGHIIIDRNTNSQPIYLRYNMEKNELEFLRDDELYITDSKKLNGFKFYAKDKDILFKNGYNTDINDIKPTTLLRVVYNGNIKLLARHSAILTKDVASYGTATKENKYSTFKIYYLVTKDGTFHQLKDVSKDIPDILADHTKEIENYASSNGLDFKNENDIAKILKHYDSIVNK